MNDYFFLFVFLSHVRGDAFQTVEGLLDLVRIERGGTVLVGAIVGVIAVRKPCRCLVPLVGTRDGDDGVRRCLCFRTRRR